MELLLAETIAVARRTAVATPSACTRVTIDTTVQTKALAPPTDSRLFLRGIEWLNRHARRHGIRLRQAFLRVARRARGDISRRLHGGRRISTSEPDRLIANQIHQMPGLNTSA